MTPLDPDGSHAARLGAEIRSRRLARGLTLERLGRQIGFSAQHLSEVERGNASVSEVFDVLHRAPVIGRDLRELAHRLAAA